MEFNQITCFDGKHKFVVDKPIRLIELFGGLGCQSSALEKLNVSFEHYRMCDIDKFAVETYNALHGTNFIPTDITKLNAKDLGIIETNKYCYVMTYSFPCTDLSKAGNQAGMNRASGTQSSLLWEVDRLLKNCAELPQVLLLENVPGILNKKNILDFAEWQKTLEGLGYKNYWQVLNSKDYGIPQNRERFFMVSLLGDYYYNFPQPFELQLKFKDMLEIKVDKKYFLSNKYQKKFNGKYIEAFGKRKNQSNTVYFDSDITSRTLCASDHKRPVLIQVNNKIRRLTPKEYWRLMGLTDEQFKSAKESGISNLQLYKQAGNGIVVNVLIEIFKKLIQ